MKRYILHILLGVTCTLQAQDKIYPNDVFAGSSHIESYLEAIGNHAIIYSGKEETKYPNYISNHPYLDTDRFREGMLSFDGIVYPNIKMRLNLHSEELIVSSPDNRFSIVVPNDRIDFATMDSLFIFYNSPGKGDLRLPEGYHVRLYKGTDYEIWKRETMFLETKIRDMQVDYFFTGRRKFYLYKDGIYHPAGSEKMLLSLFDPTKKKDVKKYIKQQRLNFKKYPDEAIVSVVSYYETLFR